MTTNRNSKKEADTIIFNTTTLQHFAVCRGCIGDEDHIVPDNLITEFVKETDY